MSKILCLGKDNVLHCCEVSDKSTTSCGSVTVKQVNPDLGKLQTAGIELIWCYECSYLLEQQEEVFINYE